LLFTTMRRPSSSTIVSRLIASIPRISRCRKREDVGLGAAEHDDDVGVEALRVGGEAGPWGRSLIGRRRDGQAGAVPILQDDLADAGAVQPGDEVGQEVSAFADFPVHPRQSDREPHPGPTLGPGRSRGWGQVARHGGDGRSTPT